MALDHTAAGVYVIAPTPFRDDGRVDEASTDRMTDFFVESGATGITVLGVMGEAPKLDQAEALAIATRMIGHTLPETARTPAIAAIQAMPSSTAYQKRQRIQAAILMVAVSPDFVIQQ